MTKKVKSLGLNWVAAQTTSGWQEFTEKASGGISGPYTILKC